MAEEIIFRVGAETSSAERSINEMEKEIEQARKSSDGFINSLDKIDKKLSSGSASIRDMNKAIADYKAIAINAGESSPVGQFAIQKASELRAELDSLNKQVDVLSDSGKNLQGAMQIGSGIVAGYGALQGAQALLGSENENLQKTFVKLQAIQSTLAGIEQIRLTLEKESAAMILIKTTATKIATATQVIYTTAVGATTGAMKALRIAMLALPIVAIVAGIVGLIFWIKALTEAEEVAEKQNDSLTASYERQTTALDRASKARKQAYANQKREMEDQGASLEELHQLELDNLKNAEAERTRAVAIERAQVLQKKLLYQVALREGNTELATEIGKEIKQHRDKYIDLKALDGQYSADKKHSDAEYNNKKKEETAKTNEQEIASSKAYQDRVNQQAKEAQKKRLEEQKLFEDLVIANIKNTNEREIAELALNQQRELDEVRKKYGEKSRLVAELEQKQVTEMIALIDAQDKAYSEAQQAIDDKAEADKLAKADADKEAENKNAKASLEAKLLRIQDDFYTEQDLLAELAELERVQALEAEKLTAGEKEKIQAEYEQKIRDLKDETAEHDKTLRKQEIDTATMYAEMGLQSVQNLTDIFFSAKLANVRKGSAEEEKLARKQFKINKALQLSGAIIDGAKAVTASLAQSPVAIGVVPNPIGIASLATAVSSSIATIAKIASTQFDSTSGGSTASVTPPSTSGSVTTDVVTDATTTNTNNLQGSSSKVVIVDSDIKASLEGISQTDVVSSFG